MRLSPEIESQLKMNFRLVMQYQHLDLMALSVLCKVYHPSLDWKWYIITQAPHDPQYLWGITNSRNPAHSIPTVGSFYKCILETLECDGHTCEIDYNFKPVAAVDLYTSLLMGLKM